MPVSKSPAFITTAGWPNAGCWPSSMPREKKRKAAYADLIKTTAKVTSVTPKGLFGVINAMPGADLRVVAMSFKLIIMSN
jgi:hypothetical protein